LGFWQFGISSDSATRISPAIETRHKRTTQIARIPPGNRQPPRRSISGQMLNRELKSRRQLRTQRRLPRTAKTRANRLASHLFGEPHHVAANPYLLVIGPKPHDFRFAPVPPLTCPSNGFAALGRPQKARPDTGTLLEYPGRPLVTTMSRIVHAALV